MIFTIFHIVNMAIYAAQLLKSRYTNILDNKIVCTEYQSLNPHCADPAPIHLTQKNAIIANHLLVNYI